MRIVDLRPWIVRTATASWRRRFGGAGARMQDAGWTGWLQDAEMKRRAAARPAAPRSAPLLVSVGNLALGGTGKTPVVGALAADLAARGLRGAVLVRGYGSRLRGPLAVDPADARAGDEARMHAAHLAEFGWSVVQSRRRPLGLAYLEERCPGLDVVLLEDAHQTAGLPRHLDIVILDRWRTVTGPDGDVLQPRTGPVFPFGPWRESARGARRAGILLVESALDVPALSDCGQPVGTFSRQVDLVDPRGGETAATPARGWAAVSGIAHPEVFERGAAGALGTELAAAVRCSDHAAYTPESVARIRGEMRHADASGLVTTQKDWIKLEGMWPAGEPVRVVRQRIVWSSGNALPDLVGERAQTLSI